MECEGGKLMTNMNVERIKALIELSSDVHQADKIIVKQGFTATREKIAFLSGMFDFKIIGRCREKTVTNEESDVMDYYAILDAIINAKWEA